MSSDLAPHRTQECIDNAYADLVVWEVGGLLKGENVQPERIAAFRAHENVCNYCRWVRQKIGEETD